MLAKQILSDFINSCGRLLSILGSRNLQPSQWSRVIEARKVIEAWSIFVQGGPGTRNSSTKLEGYAYPPTLEHPFDVAAAIPTTWLFINLSILALLDQ